MNDQDQQSDAVAKPQPTLQSERLILRPFQIDDADSVQQSLQCRDIAKNTRTVQHPYPDGQALIWIKSHLQLWNEGKAAVFAICQKESPDRVAGAIGLEINSEHENAELGYWIDRAEWGKGICTEAAARLVEFGFQHFCLHRIHANHYAHNPGSGRVLAKIGMQREGEFRQHAKKWGVFEDVVYFGILNPTKN